MSFLKIISSQIRDLDNTLKNQSITYIDKTCQLQETRSSSLEEESVNNDHEEAVAAIQNILE